MNFDITQILANKFKKTNFNATKTRLLFIEINILIETIKLFNNQINDQI